MKTIEEQGGYAFACAAENGHQGGMTLRDWFAGMAMKGMLSSHSVKDNGEDDILNFDTISEMSYYYADAMLKARGK